MATTLDELIATLQKSQNNAYQPLTQEQIQQKAVNRYSSLYDQKRNDLQTEYEQNKSALNQQLAGLQKSYDKEREATAENYRKTASQTDRYSLSRGMQRSSYNNATIANIGLKGNKALGDIDAAQRTAEGNLGEPKKLLEQQYIRQQNQYNQNQANDILAYIDELEAREYERGQTDTNLRNQLALQLYNYQFQREQAAQDQANWQAQFDAQYGRRGGGSNNPGHNNPPTTTPTDSGSVWDDVLSLLYGDPENQTNDSSVFGQGSLALSTSRPQNATSVTQMQRNALSELMRNRNQ